MDNEKATFVSAVVSLLMVLAILVFVLATMISAENKYQSQIHSDDVEITEWISPDGVHYWYQRAGYHAMLAPRYDENGELVIDNE